MNAARTPLWRSGLALGAGLVLMLGAAQMGQLSTGRDPEIAALRVAFRATAAFQRTCRATDPAELAATPAHMRRDEICVRRAVPYRLELWLDEEPQLDRVFMPRGVHQDLPVIVDAQLEIPPGRHRLRVQFEPEAVTSDTGLPAYAFAGDLDLRAGEIAVLSLEHSAGQPELRLIPPRRR